MCARFSDERYSALYDVDESSDRKGADEHHGDVQHRSRSGGTGDDDEETDRIGERERAEVTGCVRDVAVDVGREEVRGGQDDDLHGDEGEQPPRDERAGPAVLRGSGTRDGSAEAGHRRRDGDAGPSSKIVDLSANAAHSTQCATCASTIAGSICSGSPSARAESAACTASHVEVTGAPPGALSFVPAVWDHSLVPSDRILREVVARAVEGDATAFVEFVALTESDVWKLCHALGSDGDVEDLVQETYLRAIRSMGSFRGDARVMAWLMRIGRNVCADHVRIRQRERGLVERLGPPGPRRRVDRTELRLRPPRRPGPTASRGVRPDPDARHVLRDGGGRPRLSCRHGSVAAVSRTTGARTTTSSELRHRVRDRLLGGERHPQGADRDGGQPTIKFVQTVEELRRSHGRRRGRMLPGGCRASPAELRRHDGPFGV